MGEEEQVHVLLFVGGRLSTGRATQKLDQAQHDRDRGHCRGPSPGPSPGSIVFHGYVGWPISMLMLAVVAGPRRDVLGTWQMRLCRCQVPGARQDAVGSEGETTG